MHPESKQGANCNGLRSYRRLHQGFCLRRQSVPPRPLRPRLPMQPQGPCPRCTSTPMSASTAATAPPSAPRMRSSRSTNCLRTRRTLPRRTRLISTSSPAARFCLLRLRFVVSQVRRKNKNAPNLGHPSLLQDKWSESQDIDLRAAKCGQRLRPHSCGRKLVEVGSFLFEWA